MWVNRTEIMGETQGQPWGREEDQEEEETPGDQTKGAGVEREEGIQNAGQWGSREGCRETH